MTRRPIYKGTVVDLGIEQFTLPDGRPHELEIVRHPGGAAVVAINESHALCLLRQYRHAAGGWLWELPAGKLETHEQPLSTAQRELEEEAGLTARHWRSLGEVITTPGFCDEVIHLYLASDLTSTATDHQDDELIECHWVPWQQAMQWAARGEIRDAKTLLGIYRAAAMINPE